MWPGLPCRLSPMRLFALSLGPSGGRQEPLPLHTSKCVPQTRRHHLAGHHEWLLFINLVIYKCKPFEFPDRHHDIALYYCGAQRIKSTEKYVKNSTDSVSLF